MKTKQTHRPSKDAHGMDLSVPFTMTVEDVAALLGISANTARQRTYRGRIAVQPKPRRNGTGPFEWSSLDWWKYYNGRK